jgi:N-carbamoyl-L-amino-acid hydrolase
MLPLAHAVLAARRVAGELGCVATVGRVLVEPNGTNSVPTTVTAWLDARAADDVVLDDFLVRWAAFVSEAAVAESVGCQVLEESRSAAVSFDPDLADRIAAVLARRQLPVVRLATAAGHDAGVLAAAVPTGMLFVRNPTGVSHSSTEGASDADCVTGIEVLADVIEDLACR